MRSAAILLSAALVQPSLAPMRTDGAQGGHAYNYYLVGLEVSGANRLSREQVLGLAGLRTGHSVTSRDIVAARTRLSDSGLFAKVAYRTRTTGDGYSVIVTFIVEDLPWDRHVLFDNFVGLTDATLTDAIAASLPTFAGLAPGSPAALETVRVALEKAAAEAGQPGRVTYILIDDQLLHLRHYRFRLERASGPLRVCSVTVKNSVGALHDRMAATMRVLVGNDFSRDYATRYAMQNLVPIGTSQGYLHARVSDVQAMHAAASEGCKGVDVTIAIEDGGQYRWQGATWNGATLFNPTELDRLVGLRRDDPADATKISNAAQLVRDAYATKGHLNAAVHAEAAVDETQRRVAYTFRIDEGPQFRMGRLQIDGLAPDLVDRVKPIWELAEGDVFDQSCAARFVSQARLALRGPLGRFPQTEIRTTADRARLAVDVLILFKPQS